MAGGKRGGAGERVLESRHVIGLFLLMLVFSGVFFTLGFVMGRSQYDGQVRAASNPKGSVDPFVTPTPKQDTGKHTKNVPAPVAEAPADPAAAPDSGWEFYHAGDPKKTDDRLKPLPPAGAPAKKTSPVMVKGSAPAKSAGAQPKLSATPALPNGAYTLQVAALTRESDALDLASRLQKKKFPAYVSAPQGDKFYRVQVGPYGDQKSADAAKKGLEGAGFKAIVKH
jgi:septal ring-binding cell division protein DamX